MVQNRQNQRLKLTFPVLVEAAGEVKRLLAGDVSEKGMLIVSREPYILDERLRITFSLPTTDVELVAKACVRHVTWSKEQAQFHVGVEFGDFEEGEMHPPLRCLPS